MSTTVRRRGIVVDPEPPPPDLLDVARHLYGAPPSGFVAARTAAARVARQAGDRALATAVAALRRPSTAAAAVNLLVRERPEDVGALLDLGVRLREAQAALASTDLRVLHAEQQRTMAQVVPAAVDLAAAGGPRVGAAVRAQVEATLRAAMGDPDAAAAVATGLLVRDLFSSGLEPVDVTGAVAVEDAPPLAGAPARRTPMRVVPEARPSAAAADGGPRTRRRRGRLIQEEPDADAGTSPGLAGARAGRARVGAGGRSGGRSARADAEPSAVEVRRPETGAAARAEARTAARTATLRSADADVVLARTEAEERRAVLAAADTRQDAAGTRAAELADQVRRTTEEIARLRAVLADAEREAREAGPELRHARSARIAAAQAAERAESRLRAAQRARSDLGDG
jgi:hypothetical protein